MSSFQYKTLAVALTSIGLSACGGDSGSSTPAAATGAPAASADAAPGATGTSVTASGSCSLPAAMPAAGPEQLMDINTGAYAPDQANTDNWLPLTIALDSLAVSSTSPCFTITRASDNLSHVSIQGQPAITLSRDAHGLTIRSTTAAPVAYRLTGTGNTPITLYSDADYELELANASITSPDGPALNLQSTRTAFIDLQGQNTLRDSAAWSARTTPAGVPMDLKATLFSEGPVVIRGTGSLNISATPQHALASDAHVRLRSGRLAVESAARDGIRVHDAFVMDDGTLDIRTPAGKGIKVDGKEDATQALGFVAINGGNLTINSHDKAITASWEADEDADTPATTDDPDPRVTINGGTLNITTTGPVRNDSDDPPGTNAPSPEGIEAKSVITINNGNISLNTQDDSLNAGTGLYITGGQIYAHSVLNDSLDSNGPMTISGGVLVATSRGPDPEGALDSDSSTFTITGGTFVGLGYYNSTPSADVSTQNIVTVTNGLNAAVAPGLWTLRDATGRAVFAFDIPFAAHYLTLSSPHIADGAAYTVVTGGTLSPVERNFHGLALNPTTHTGGTAGPSLTINQRLTALGPPFQWPPAGPTATP